MTLVVMDFVVEHPRFSKESDALGHAFYVSSPLVVLTFPMRVLRGIVLSGYPMLAVERVWVAVLVWIMLSGVLLG